MRKQYPVLARPLSVRTLCCRSIGHPLLRLSVVAASCNLCTRSCSLFYTHKICALIFRHHLLSRLNGPVFRAPSVAAVRVPWSSPHQGSLAPLFTSCLLFRDDVSTLGRRVASPRLILCSAQRVRCDDSCARRRRLLMPGLESVGCICPRGWLSHSRHSPLTTVGWCGDVASSRGRDVLRWRCA